MCAGRRDSDHARKHPDPVAVFNEVRRNAATRGSRGNSPQHSFSVDPADSGRRQGKFVRYHGRRVLHRPTFFIPYPSAAPAALRRTQTSESFGGVQDILGPRQRALETSGAVVQTEPSPVEATATRRARYSPRGSESDGEPITSRKERERREERDGESPIEYRRRSQHWNREWITAEPQRYIQEEKTLEGERDDRLPTPGPPERQLYDPFLYDFNFPDSFNLPAKDANDTLVDEGTLDGKSVEPDETPIHDFASIAGAGLKPTVVYDANYTGSAELGGSHSATLGVLHDPKDQRASLFRWLHIRQEVMNLDDFWAEVSRQPRFSEPEKKALEKLRAEVQRSCVKSVQNPKGSRVGSMEPRSIEIPLRPEKSRKSVLTEDAGSARWICIPYFVQQRYSGLLAASNTSSFPSQTLLQAQYSRNTQQRDMEQAVCQLGVAKRGDCFHVAQLWCLVVANSFLFTCGTMPREKLQGQTVTIKNEPSRKLLTAAHAERIFVKFGDAITWVFPTDECRTWTAFVSHFQAFWPQSLEFKHKSEVVTAEFWPKVLKLASRPGPRVTIVLKTASRPNPPATAILQPLNAQSDIPGQNASPKSTERQFFHVLQELACSQRGPSVSSGEESDLNCLKRQLAEADNFMTTLSPGITRKEYADCQGSTRQQVHDCLEKEPAPDFDDDDDDDDRVAYENRIDVFNAADILFRFFLPPAIEAPTVGKFWGAVLVLCKKPTNLPNEKKDMDPFYMARILRQMVPNILEFEARFAVAGDQREDGIEVPQKFMTAWLYVLSGLTAAASKYRTYDIHLGKACRLIDQGIEEMVLDMPAGDLLDKVAMMPLDVLPLVILELLKDQVGKSNDISETYSQYLNSLDTDITTKPPDRSYQQRIDLVRQEMKTVQSVLAKQRLVIDSIGESILPKDTDEPALPYRRIAREQVELLQHNTLDSQQWDGLVDNEYGVQEGPDDRFAKNVASASKLSPTDRAGFRGFLFAECALFIEQRELDFRRYREHADDLERSVINKVDWTKDRQESAIYAFTLVTIIFLPLSAVASVFGMNTRDIRNMPVGQWAYWAVALPVTFLVILIGLWWMDELGNIARWISGRRSTRSSLTLSNSARSSSTYPIAGTVYATRPAQGDAYNAPMPVVVQNAPMQTRIGGGYSEEYEAAAPGMRRRPQAWSRY